MLASIYQITNKVNNDFYVGKTTKTLTSRLYRHRKNAEYGNDTYLYRAMRKYGYDNFDIRLVESTSSDVINDRERHWISALCPVYNMTPGGDGGDTSRSPNYQNGMKTRRSFAGNENPMFGRTRTIPQQQLDNMHAAAKEAHKRPVSCAGKIYPSVDAAETAYGHGIRHRLNSDKWPGFYRLPKLTEFSPRAQKSDR